MESLACHWHVLTGSPHSLDVFKVAILAWDMMQLCRDCFREGKAHSRFPCPTRADKQPSTWKRFRGQATHTLANLLKAHKGVKGSRSVLLSQRFWKVETSLSKIGRLWHLEKLSGRGHAATHPSDFRYFCQYPLFQRVSIPFLTFGHGISST